MSNYPQSEQILILKLLITLGTVEKIAVAVTAGLYGTVTEKAINGERVTGGQLIEASVWNAVWDNLPTKYLGPLGRRKLFTFLFCYTTAHPLFT